VSHRRATNQNLVDRRQRFALDDAAAGRRVALRIEIDQQHALTDLGETGREIDSRRRLADAALLVGYREYSLPNRLCAKSLSRELIAAHHYQMPLAGRRPAPFRRCTPSTRTSTGKRAISSSGRRPFMASQ
jgi:hypothetical protein